jgi:hydroxyacylglutathione hydrolase
MPIEIIRVSLGGIGNFNCYLVKSNGVFTLIDTGVVRLRRKLISELNKNGCNSQNLKLVILTNGTMDATGNSKYIQKNYNAKISIHLRDLDMIEKGIYPKREFESKLPQFLYDHFIKKIGKKMTDALEKYRPDIIIENETDLVKYGFSGRIIHTPGFTPGSICVYLESGVLVSGNTIVNINNKNIPPFVLTSYNTLNASLRYLSKMDIKNIFPGMGEPFSRTKGIINSE